MQTGNPASVLVAQGLVKKYARFQLGPLDLDLQPGYVYGIVGPNGAGKTTLLKLLMNLARPTAGSCRLFGMDYAGDEQAIKQRIGFVPEEPFLYQLMNAQWFGRFAAPFYPEWNATLYRQMLAQLHVDDMKPVKALSRGTKVKLELALALSHNPDLLLLDEPTSGLDPLVRREILDLLADMVQDERKTVVFSTHITEDVERIADYIIFLVNGSVALMADRETLRDNWQELLLDAADARNLPGIVRIKHSDQPTVQVVVSDAAAAMTHLRGIGKAPLHQRPLALDEILGELVQKLDAAA